MKAMLFAAGKGTRLKPLTDRHPKCLVTAGNKTLLEHNILKLRAAGVDTLVINTHHFGDQVSTFIDSNDFGMTIHISREEELLETGGGLLHASEHFLNEEAFIVCNSDIYSDIDLGALISQHKQNQSLATLAVADRVTSRYLRFNEQDHLCGWENRKSGETISWNHDTFKTKAFQGTQIISPGLFDFMGDMGKIFSTIPVYMKAAQAGERISAFPMDHSYWIDIGTVEKLEALREHLHSSPGRDSNPDLVI